VAARHRTSRYDHEIDQLKAALVAQRKKDGVFMPQEQYDKLQVQMRASSNAITECVRAGGVATQERAPLTSRERVGAQGQAGRRAHTALTRATGARVLCALRTQTHAASIPMQKQLATKNAELNRANQTIASTSCVAERVRLRATHVCAQRHLWRSPSSAVTTPNAN
jgi:hypothetical protein